MARAAEDAGVKQPGAKAGVQPAARAGASDKSAKKEKKGSNLILLLIIIVLTAMIAFGAIFLFNIGGMKAEVSKMLVNIPVVGKLVKPVVENKTPEQIAGEELELREKDLAVKLQELNDKNKELDSRERAVSAKEEELSQKELELQDMEAKLSDKLASVQEQVQYFEKIDNNKAVQILLSMDDKATVVQILRNMKKDKASQILGLMDPLQAAQLLEDLSAGAGGTAAAQENAVKP